ncbi:cytochrome c3 family protein [Aeoliella sp. SH292]|uniref:cytochrome c3 family protein n=1 Tax=Aeoliella sp. SH292 TaxID=3454464 RepID=UPI003F96EE6B
MSWSVMLVGALAAGIAFVAAAVSTAPDTDRPVVSADSSQDTFTNPYSVTIVGACPTPGIPTGEVDRLGNPVLANCTTCHATRPANVATKDGAQLKEFHQGLTTAHGGLACVACHNPGDYSQLRLASGDALEFTDSLRLCAQCHGPQFRDYENGAHGGMTGHWDLSAGPRVRNHCLACHDAHAPKYQQVMPVFAPRDLSSGGSPTTDHR